MRLVEYKEIIRQAKTLPTEIPELRSYFRDTYNPQKRAIDHIIQIARSDERLKHQELLSLLQFITDNS